MAVNTEFYHHGVKGQKWGVRRYRNANGSLTPAGKKRAKELNDSVDRMHKRELDSAHQYNSQKMANTNSQAKKNYFKAKNAIDRVRADKLRDIRREEVQKGFDFLERRTYNKSVVATKVGLIGGAVAGSNVGRVRTGAKLGVIGANAAVAVQDRAFHGKEYKRRRVVNKAYKADLKKAKKTYRSERKAEKRSSK